MARASNRRNLRADLFSLGLLERRGNDLVLVAIDPPRRFGLPGGHRHLIGKTARIERPLSRGEHTGCVFRKVRCETAQVSVSVERKESSFVGYQTRLPGRL